MWRPLRSAATVSVLSRLRLPPPIGDAGAVLHGRRQFDFHRRYAADRDQPKRREGTPVAALFRHGANQKDSVRLGLSGLANGCRIERLQIFRPARET